MVRTALILSLAAVLPLPARADIDFTADFEAGSKWFTESWSAAARAEMEAFLDDLGAMFDVDATVRVRITDDATSAYASAGSSWYQWFAHDASGGMVRAPGLWMIVVQGVQNPSAESDVVINWNLDVDTLYGGSSASLIGNIRGLGRHEMHHAFGSSSFLYFEESPEGDPRGFPTYATVIDTLYRDKNGQPLLGAFDPETYTYTVNDFALSESWASDPAQSGLYFEARDRQGRVVPMPPMSGSGYIDFSHIRGISYVSDHPTWNTYVDTDLNFLRALGYPLMADSALRQQPAAVTAYTIGESEASFTVDTQAGRHYRLTTSTDLRRWKVLPAGKSGTGSALGFTHPVDKAADPKRFFQIVEIPE